MFSVEHTHHLVLFNDQYSSGHKRRGRPHTDTLTCQATFTKEVAGPQYPHDSLFADRIDNREFYAAALNVHHTGCGITLGVYLL